MTLKKAAALFGVSNTSVINREIKDKILGTGRMDKIKQFLNGQ